MCSVLCADLADLTPDTLSRTLYHAASLSRGHFTKWPLYHAATSSLRHLKTGHFIARALELKKKPDILTQTYFHKIILSFATVLKGDLVYQAVYFRI